MAAAARPPGVSRFKKRGRPGSVYKLCKNASSAAVQLDEVNSLTKAEDRTRHVFGDLLDETEEQRKKHRERLGDEFFAKFDLSPEKLPDCGDIEPVGRDTFPTNSARLDTLSTAGLEGKQRANASIDESYQTAVQAVLLGGGDDEETLLERVRDVFGVDEAVHRGCVDQVGGIADALDAEIVLTMTRLSVTTGRARSPAERDAVAPAGAVLAMIEAVTADSPEVTSKKALAKKLCKAVEAVGESGKDLGDVRSLLDQGADPNLSAGRRGSAMLIAAEVNQPALTTLLVEKGGDPSLERNSRRAQLRGVASGSSGVFETVPVEVDEAGCARFPDEFTVPLPSSGGSGAAGSVVCIEFWRTNAALPALSPPAPAIDTGESFLVPPPGGKRKRVRRRFFRSRSRKVAEAAARGGTGTPSAPARIVIEKDGDMIEYIGAVSFSVDSLAVGKPQTIRLGDVGEGGASATEVTVRLSADLTDIARQRRKQHQDVLEKLVVAGSRNFWSDPANHDRVWDGSTLGQLKPIIGLHARWARLTALEAALDTFCAVVELSSSMAVSSTVMLPLLSAPLDAAPDGFGELSEVDHERLVAALEAVATSCFYVAVHPHKCVGRDDAGVAELTAALRVLQLVYSIDEWQQATIGMGQTAEDTPDTPVPLDSPILLEAAEIVDRQLQAGKIDYRSVKAVLLEAHSAEAFDSCKRAVQQLCAEAATQLDDRRRRESSAASVLADDAEGDAGAGAATGQQFDEPLIVKRAREIIESGAKKLLTYPTVKGMLVKEFGLRVFSEHRRVISAEIVLSMGRRMRMMRQIAQRADAGHQSRRVLAVELTVALENFVKECYENIRHRVNRGLSSDFEGRELVTLVRTMDALVSELDGIQKWFDNAYRGVKGMVLTNSFAMWYDKLVSADLRSVLSMWEHRCTENNFPFLFFNLLFSTRRLWDWMESHLGELEVADFRLFQYREWFYPFVTAWLIQSKAAALQMVNRAIKLDSWRPVAQNRLVSESSIDITRIVYEVVSMFQKIDWPDREANEEALFQLLSDAVCASFRTYSIAIRELCVGRGGGGGCDGDDASGAAASKRGSKALDGAAMEVGEVVGDFFLDDDTCIIVNNLEYVSVRLHGLHKFMQVAEVAESHRRRAERQNQGHRGDIKPHGAVRLFHNANSHIQKCIIGLGNYIAERLCVRLHRDLEIIYDRFHAAADSGDPDVAAALRKRELDDAVDGLVSEQDDLRVALPQSAVGERSRLSVFEWSPLVQAVRTRKAIKARDKQLKPDGYVYVNLFLLASKMEYVETRNKVVECLWRNLMIVLGTVLSKQACDERTSADQLLGLTMDINRCLTDFLVAEGDGIPHDELERLSAVYLNPICACFRMSSQDLVRYLYQNAACSRAGPIVDFVHKSKPGAAEGDAEPLPIRKFSMMDQFELDVQADVTSSGVDSVRLIAGEAQPHKLGYLRLRLLRFGDDTRGKSLRVNLVGGIKLSRSSVFVKSKAIASSGVASAVKFKSQVVRGSFNPTFDEGFTVPNCSDGICVEIRVYEESSSGVFSSLLSSVTRRGTGCIGEVLLDLTIASELDGEAVLDFPLHPVEYTGQLRQAQELLRNRTDKVAKEYTAEHTQDAPAEGAA